MSNYKNGRLSKYEYLNLIEKEGRLTKSCHKKKNYSISKFDNGLKYSRDNEGNLLCAGCKVILAPKNISNEDLNERIDKLIKMGGCYNCCYDCEFSSYCNKCAFTHLNSKGYYFSTCYHSFIKQVKNNNYKSGRYSQFTDLEHKCLQDFCRNHIKHNGNMYGNFVDMDFLLDLYKDNTSNKEFQIYRKVVKNIVSNLTFCDTSIEPTNYDCYNITKEKVYKQYYDLQENKNELCKDTIENSNTHRQEMKGPSSENFKSLENLINMLKLAR